MSKIKTTQAELDAIFARMEREYTKLNKRQQTYAIKEMGRIKGDIATLLNEYVGTEGVIDRRRAGRLIRELDEVERTLRRTGDVALNEIISDTSEWTTSRVHKATGMSVSKAQFDRINEHIVRYVIKRNEGDNLVLSDRIWGLSAEVREEMSTVLRSGIIRGESVRDMMPKIGRVYDTETWKIRRLVRTESSTAQRAAISYNAQASNIVKWVQFNDGTCGRKDHHKHKCYELANTDKYGKGNGVYRPNDTEIWLPHPNCTSYITYIVDDI